MKGKVIKVCDVKEVRYGESVGRGLMDYEVGVDKLTERGRKQFQRSITETNPDRPDAEDAIGKRNRETRDRKS